MIFAVYLLLSAVSAALAAGRIGGLAKTSERIVAAGVLWTLFQTLPLHLAAAANVAGLVERVEFGWLTALQAALAITLALGARGRRTADAGGQPPLEPLPLPILFACAVTAAAYAVSLAMMALSYPQAWDAVAYHLPKALLWLQTGQFGLIDKSWQLGLPGNGEMAMLFWLGAGRESLTGLVAASAAAVLAAASYRIALALEVSRPAALAATLVLLSVPMVFHQSVAGASCGLSLGAKTTFVVYAAVFAAAAMAAIARGLLRVPLALALLFGGMAAPSAFWFGRATAATGNPIYPLQVKLAGHVVFDGYPPEVITPRDYGRKFVRGDAEWFVYPWVEWKEPSGVPGVPYDPGSGVGAAFAAFGALGAVYSLLGLARGRRVAPEIALVAAIAFLSIVWWFVMHRVPRFGLPILAMACALTAPLLDRLLRRSPRGASALLVATLGVTFVVSLLPMALASASQLRGGRLSRAEFYGYPPLLDELPAGSRVANGTRGNGAYQNSVLAGKRLANRVVPHYKVPERLSAEWLMENQIEYVAVRSDGEARRDALAQRGEIGLTEVAAGRQWSLWATPGTGETGASPPAP